MSLVIGSQRFPQQILSVFFGYSIVCGDHSLTSDDCILLRRRASEVAIVCAVEVLYISRQSVMEIFPSHKLSFSFS